MWILRPSENGWFEVGYFNPSGLFIRIHSVERKSVAMAIVSYLNGGERVIL